MNDTETFSEQLSRVELMADGDPTWDLSDNDTAALKAVLKDYRRLAQASRPAPPLDWHPIATAPKDGTWIFGYAPSLKIQFFPAVIFWVDNGWSTPVDDDAGFSPTHWMPLPAPLAAHAAPLKE